MSKYLLLTFLNLITFTICFAQIKQPQAGLSQQDKKNYVLSVNKASVSHGVIFIQVTLSNTSGDTLRYMNMTCDWDIIFDTNNKDLSRHERICESNFPEIIKLAPHKSSLFNLPFTAKAGISTRKFKVGIYLFRYQKIQDFEAFNNLLIQEKRSWPTNDLIWSNEVVIPR